jgi:hypothetical protein
MGNFFLTSKNKKDSEDNKAYWMFYGILIPYNIEKIPSIDGVNWICSRGGSETLMCRLDDYSYSLEEYQKLYAFIGSDGKLYWKE